MATAAQNGIRNYLASVSHGVISPSPGSTAVNGVYIQPGNVVHGGDTGTGTGQTPPATQPPGVVVHGTPPATPPVTTDPTDPTAAAVAQILSAFNNTGGQGTSTNPTTDASTSPVVQAAPSPVLTYVLIAIGIAGVYFAYREFHKKKKESA